MHQTKSTTVTPGFVSAWETGQYGSSFRIGFTKDDGQQVYLRCKKQELLSQFENGKPTAITFYTTEKGNHYIVGAESVGWNPAVSTANAGDMFGSSTAAAPAGQAAPVNDFESRKRESIEKQTIYNGYMAAHSGSKTALDPQNVIDFIEAVYKGAFAKADQADAKTLETVEEKVAAAAEVLDATVEPTGKLADEDNDENFGF